MEQSSIATGFNIAAMTLEAFAKSVLDGRITSNSEAARIGAEEMRSKIASMAMELTRNLRDQAHAPQTD